MQQKNLLLAIVLTILIWSGWAALSQYFWPPPAPKPKSTEVAKTDDKNKLKDGEAKKADAKDKQGAEKKADEKEIKRIAAADLQGLPATPDDKLVRLGAKQRDSRFHLFVELDPRGAGVRSL